MCRQLTDLIANGQAPSGSIAPRPVQRDGLFKLDVDDNIWQDIGLNDGNGSEIPRWLGDEEVRSGIQALLQHDRCCEEELRLRKERCNLQQWFMEEWDGIEAARREAGEHSIIPCQILLLMFLGLPPQFLALIFYIRLNYVHSVCANSM